MAMLLAKTATVSAENNQPGPWERFLRSVRHAFTEQRPRPQSHSTRPRSRSVTATVSPSPSPAPAETTGVNAPPDERNIRTATRAVSKKGDDFRYGIPVPGKKGFVTSPYSPDSGYIDVRGFQPGTPVKDPYSGKIILTP
jgi:hypothetical protein